MSALAIHSPRFVDIASAQRMARYIQFGTRVVDQAADVGAGLIVFHPGNDAETLPRVVNRRNAQVMGAIADYAAQSEIDLVVENGWYYGCGRCIEDLIAIVSLAERPNLGICFDTGHAHVAGLDIVESLAKAAPHLRLLHCNDNNGERDEHLVPGSGGIDWALIGQELARQRYRGPAVLELNGQADAPLRDPASELSLGIRKVRALLGVAAGSGAEHGTGSGRRVVEPSVGRGTEFVGSQAPGAEE